MLILRGLARSATGMMSWSTPSRYAGGDLIQIKVVSEDQLSAEDTSGPFGCDQLARSLTHRSVGAYGQNVALDVEVDRVRVHPGQVKFHNECIALAPGVHWHERGSCRGPKHLLAQPVQLTEWISAHQHHESPPEIKQVESVMLASTLIYSVTIDLI
jgi:hypothetical protein